MKNNDGELPPNHPEYCEDYVSVHDEKSRLHEEDWTASLGIDDVCVLVEDELSCVIECEYNSSFGTMTRKGWYNNGRTRLYLQLHKES